MIQSIKAEELSKFNDLLSDHLSELTEELKTCTNPKINKILRAEVSNVTSMINGLSKHKLFASSYEELTREGDSSEDEPAPPKKRASKKTVKIEEPKEPMIVAKVPRKRSPIATTSVRDALLRTK
eukprot:scaffold13484_cov139-Ochromonas_danica.AAC.1